MVCDCYSSLDSVHFLSLPYKAYCGHQHLVCHIHGVDLRLRHFLESTADGSYEQ